MCYTSDQVVEEAKAFRNAGNMPRFAECTKVLMDEFGLTIDEIQKRLRDAPAETDHHVASRATALARCD